MHPKNLNIKKSLKQYGKSRFTTKKSMVPKPSRFKEPVEITWQIQSFTARKNIMD
jgi:hypothetical protein